MRQHNSIRLGQGLIAALIMWLLIGLIPGGFFPGHAFAATAGDDFNDNSKDPAKWGGDEVDGKGVMTEINQRLEYTTTGVGTASHDSVDRLWRATRFPYNADWAIQIDVTNTTTSGDFTSFGMYVESLRLPDNAIEVELAQSGLFWAEFYSQKAISGDHYAMLFGGNTYGAVRMAFNSITKVFTMYYNPDPGDDNLWTKFGSFGVAGGLLGENGNTNWGLTDTDLFVATVFGYSEQADKITSGQLYGDNFLVTGGIGPDLVETSVSASQTTLFRGTGFKVTDTAQNTGAQAAKASVTRYYLSLDAERGAKDILLTGSRTVPSLASNVSSTNTVTVTVPATTPFGTYYLLACADDTKLVAETDETNNCLSTQSAAIEVAGPDLVETAVSASESPVFRGKSFKVTDTAQNNRGQAAGASTTRYYLSLDNVKGVGDILLTGSRAVPSLASGASSTNTVPVTVPGTTPFGKYYLLACADDTKLVTETNETNNCVATQSTIEVAGPDLIETSVSASASPVFRGKSFKLTDTAQNTGAQAAGASATRYYLSLDDTKGTGDILLTGSRAVPSLGTNATSTNTVTVTVPGTTPFGKYYLLACADDTKVVAETDETNNCVATQSAAVEVTGPDLIETSVSASASPVFRGKSFKVTDTAQNNGVQAARASVTRYYLSSDDTKGTGDILLTGSRAVLSLASGATSTNTVTVTVPGTTPFGKYYLLACADDTKVVAETDESNNCVVSSDQLEVK
jgi:subtilase family serine protease